ncbi:unnamed protein product [Rhodiola kirilowii]
MVCEMEEDRMDEAELEVVPSMWPEDVGDDYGRQFNMEKPGGEDMLEELAFAKDPTRVDFQRLLELTNYSEKGSSQLGYLVKSWEFKQANAVRLLKEELDNLSKLRKAYELKNWEIQEEHRFEEEKIGGEQRHVSILDDSYDILPKIVPRNNHVVVQRQSVEVDAEFDTVLYWKQRALNCEKLLAESVQREKILTEKLEENIKKLETQSSPVEELSQILKRADNFLHFILQNAPVVIGHQDKDLRYRFIYNHFPSFKEDDIIGKTDVEIFTGGGVKESQDFKQEVLDRGLPAKREITFDTPLFGSKTFLIYVEPVFNKAGETIGVNYMGMEVTDQVRKREKMIKLREDIAVQKAKETELNKTIHITEETMRAKQMLATMSHEIRSPLSGVVSMAEILSTSKLDREQKQLLDVMLSSGDLVLQLINDILDLSKVESGVMKLEATKFRPREVVRHVLQTSAASLQKLLTLEGHIAEDVPIEVIGDVLRIRQILTNLISNAVKFTHEGKVCVRLSVVPEPMCSKSEECHKKSEPDHSTNASNRLLDAKISSASQPCSNENGDNEEDAVHNDSSDQTVWIRCDVSDSGIGIPEKALPTLFKKYMQASTDHARKYGGTGLGLAICKQLVELMGGCLTVSSKEHYGSTFTFVLPYKVSCTPDNSDDSDDISDLIDYEDANSTNDITAGYFEFLPRISSSMYASGRPKRNPNLTLPEIDEFAVECYSSPCSNGSHPKSVTFPVDTCMASDGPFLENGNINQGVGSGSQECDQNVKISNCRDNGSSLIQPKILLVEDNKINIMVAQSMMKQLGYAIEIVNNGVDAIRAVQRDRYDLVLMDVCMPVMDGLQATRLIRSFEETGDWDAAEEAGVGPLAATSPTSTLDGCDCAQATKRLPIVAMTANSLAESAEECLASGMDSFLSKPITFQKLKECLQIYLQ